jgi:hypothetical protein
MATWMCRLVRPSIRARVAMKEASAIKGGHRPDTPHFSGKLAHLSNRRSIRSRQKQGITQVAEEEIIRLCLCVFVHFQIGPTHSETARPQALDKVTADEAAGSAHHGR